MAKKILQNYLYQKRNLIKQNIRPLKLEDEQKDYIKFFWRKNKKMFWKVVMFSAFAIFLQLLMPLFTNFYIFMPCKPNGFFKIVVNLNASSSNNCRY